MFDVGDIHSGHSVQMPTELTLAATATDEQTIFVAPFPCIVTAWDFTGDAAVTGDDTNSKNLNIINKGSDGSGTDEIANLDLASGTDLVAHDPSSIASTGTLALRTLAAGDTLTLQTEQVGSGVEIPRGVVKTSFVAAD